MASAAERSRLQAPQAAAVGSTKIQLSATCLCICVVIFLLPARTVGENTCDKSFHDVGCFVSLQCFSLLIKRRVGAVLFRLFYRARRM